MIRKLTVIAALLLIAIVSVTKTMNDGNQETSAIDMSNMTADAKIYLSGQKFDIPLAYFSQFATSPPEVRPKSNSQRTEEHHIKIYAVIEGMRPWSEDQADKYRAFDSDSVTSIVLTDSYPSDWLERYVEYRRTTLVASKEYGDIPSLTGFTSRYDAGNSFYVSDFPPKKPYVLVICGQKTSTLKMCKVHFDYLDGILVKYSIPISRLTEFPEIHANVLRLLNQFHRT